LEKKGYNNIMLNIEKNYAIKILFLFLATGAGIFAIWYALMREESVDWVSAQIAHQPSYFAITETDRGLIISNVLAGYDFNMPKGFKATGARNLDMYMEGEGKKQCEIKHSVRPAGKAGGLAAAETRLIIPFGRQKLVFELVDKSEINDCGKYLMVIKNNLVGDL